MTHADVLEVLPLYTVGGLNTADMQRVAAHLAACEACTEEYALEQRIAGHLGEPPSPEGAADRAWERIAAKAQRDTSPDRLAARSASRRDRLRVVLWRLAVRIVLAAALAVALILAIGEPEEAPSGSTPPSQAE